MNRSEKLQIAITKNVQSFNSIFAAAEIEVEGSDKSYAIFLNDNLGEVKFEAIGYITREDQSLKGAFLQQNRAIFVGFAGEHEMQVLNFSDFVKDAIEEFERKEDEEASVNY